MKTAISSPSHAPRAHVTGILITLTFIGPAVLYHFNATETSIKLCFVKYIALPNDIVKFIEITSHKLNVNVTSNCH